MTKTEAYNSMVAGNKITHDYYSPSEYISMNDKNEIITEDNVNCGKRFDEFWDVIQKWGHGWSIWKPVSTIQVKN